MARLAIVDAKKSMADHCAALMAYAERVVARGEELAPSEAADQARRMQEFLAMGSSFELTSREMVQRIFGGLFAMKRECGCPSCASRANG